MSILQYTLFVGPMMLLTTIHVYTTLLYLRMWRNERKIRKLLHQRIKRLEKHSFGGEFNVEE